MVLRRALGGALSTSAQVLSVAAKLLEVTAKTLRPEVRGAQDTAVQREPVDVAVDAPSEPIGTEAVVSDLAESTRERGRVDKPPPTPVLDQTPHVRTSETHIEELAAKPASQVIAAVAGLSTDELRLLTEYELAHKNRRTVMTAIERALGPPAADDEIVLPEAGGVPTSGSLDGT